MWEKVTDNECTIVRSFMAFVKISNPNGDEIANTSRSIFGNLAINLSKIRRQSYDSTSAMSGIHDVVQKLIKDMVNSPVLFEPDGQQLY